MREDIDSGTFIRDYLKALHSKNAAAFIGAGLSIPAGYLDWKGLLDDAIKDLRLDPDKEQDLVTVAQYYINQTGSKTGLTQRIVSEFKRYGSPQRSHLILAELPLQVYWTTNYDQLIEQALRQVKKTPDVKYNAKQLRVTSPDRDVTVYKMHGDVDLAEDAVISKDDYERYPRKMEAFVQALSGDFIERTFLFLGLSFTDPNIDYILGRIRSGHTGDPRQHYCIMKRVAKEPGQAAGTLNYDELRQQYFIKDLKRFGILTVLVDTYPEITSLLEKVATQYKRTSVFISGAAHEYGAWTRDNALQFTHDLSYALATARNRIITGFGVEIGSAVINGTLAYLDNAGKTVTDEDLVMRPFPQVITGGIDRAAKWTAYRKAMLAYAGIAVFIFGNKLEGGTTVLSNGVDEEFTISSAQGIKPIAVGATGFMAEEIWKKVQGDWDTYFPGASPAFKTDYAILGDKSKTPAELIQAVMRLVKELQKN
ncbi:MAG: SIR2 family protein [Flavobacteriales bacterium]|nr:SIR2 family protein [Flavobacteriales bacterium]